MPVAALSIRMEPSLTCPIGRYPPHLESRLGLQLSRSLFRSNALTLQKPLDVTARFLRYDAMGNYGNQPPFRIMESKVFHDLGALFHPVFVSGPYTSNPPAWVLPTAVLLTFRNEVRILHSMADNGPKCQ